MPGLPSNGPRFTCGRRAYEFTTERLNLRYSARQVQALVRRQRVGSARLRSCLSAALLGEDLAIRLKHDPLGTSIEQLLVKHEEASHRYVLPLRFATVGSLCA